MKKCESCNVTVNTKHNTCPLCFRELIDIGGKNSIDLFKQKVDKPKNKHREILVKIFAFLSLIAVVTCLIVNLFTQVYPLWSLIVVQVIVYSWILITHTILSNRGILEKILLQVISVFGLLWTCEWIAEGGKWVIDFVCPSMFVIISLVMFILAQALKNHKGVLSFFIMNIILILVTGSFLLFGVATFKLLNVIALATESICLVGIMLFTGKPLKIELSKKFHV